MGQQPRTFGDLRKYKGGRDLEDWAERQPHGYQPKSEEKSPEQILIPGTEQLLTQMRKRKKT